MSSIRSKHIFKLCPCFLRNSLSCFAIWYAFSFFCLCINSITSVSLICTFCILLLFDFDVLINWSFFSVAQ